LADAVVPPIYTVSLLQAMERVQSVAAALLLLSPLEAENYVLAFLVHHSASWAIVLLGATALYRLNRNLAFLQGVILLYSGSPTLKRSRRLR
jgi:hypothetical protein